MSPKEAVAKLSALLFKSEHKFENAKLSDGTILQWEGELTEGVAINVVDEQGNMAPAPDGTHELSDGAKITTVGGLVTAIAAKSEPDEDMATTKMMEDFITATNERLASYETKLNECETKIKTYEEKFGSIETKITDSKALVETKFEEIKTIVSEIEAAPAVPPVPTKTSAFNRKPKPEKSAAERIQEYLKSKNN